MKKLLFLFLLCSTVLLFSEGIETFVLAELTIAQADLLNRSSVREERSGDDLTDSREESAIRVLLSEDEVLRLNGRNRSPQNLNISVENDLVTITWTPVLTALNYKVYSSPTHDGVFTEDTSGNFTGASWSAPVDEDMKFYYVTLFTVDNEIPPVINIPPSFTVSEYDNHKLILNLADYISHPELEPHEIAIAVIPNFLIPVDVSYDQDYLLVTIDFVPEVDTLYHQDNHLELTIYASTEETVEATTTIYYQPLLNALLGTVRDHYTDSLLVDVEVSSNGFGLRVSPDGQRFLVFEEEDVSFTITKDGYYDSIRYIEFDENREMDFGIIPDQTCPDLGYDYVELAFHRVFRASLSGQRLTRWEEKPVVCVDDSGEFYGVTPTQTQLNRVNETLEFYPLFTDNFTDPLNEPGNLIINGTTCWNLVENNESFGTIFITWRSYGNPVHFENFATNGATIIRAYAIFHSSTTGQSYYRQEMLQVLGARRDINALFPYEWPPGQSIFCSRPGCLTVITELDLLWGVRAYRREVMNSYPDTDPSAYADRSVPRFTEVREFWTVTNEDGTKESYTQLLGYYHANKTPKSLKDVFQEVPEGAELIPTPIDDMIEIADPLEVEILRETFYSHNPIGDSPELREKLMAQAFDLRCGYNPRNLTYETDRPGELYLTWIPVEPDNSKKTCNDYHYTHQFDEVYISRDLNDFVLHSVSRDRAAKVELHQPGTYHIFVVSVFSAYNMIDDILHDEIRSSPSRHLEVVVD